jgi:two-component system cell cycle response regulator
MSGLKESQLKWETVQLDGIFIRLSQFARYHREMGSLLNTQRRILIVDDDPDIIRLVEGALKWEGYQVECVRSGQEALARIKAQAPHLILLDVNMPGLNGLETLNTLRNAKEYVSVLFLSGNSSTEDKVRGLDAGADDYLVKPFDVQELNARVRCQLRIKDLQDQLRGANQKLKELSETDDLTGLYNMRALYPKLEHELERARRHGRSVCVMMMDMDYFKKVNDDHDHLFGSFVLSQVGQLVRENIRNIDFASRYGGDEFLVVLSEIDAKSAAALAERLRKKIEAVTFKNELHQTQVTASIGFAVAYPSLVPIDSRALVRQADQALYEAKDQGRNCVRSYNVDSIEQKRQRA